MVLLAQFLQDSLSTYPDRPAIVCGEEELSYQQLSERSAAIAESLSAAGVTPHAKVVLFYPTEPDFVACFLGLQQLGAVACPLNIEQSASEHVDLLKLIDPDLVIVSDRAAECRESIETVWNGPVVSAGELEAGEVEAMVEPRTSDPDLEDVAVILCTSGTTGLPKAAMLTHSNLTENLQAFRDHLPSFPGREWSDWEKFGNPIPVFHPYGLIMMTLMPLFLKGTSVQIPRFSPPATLKAITSRRVTFFGGVPSIYAMLNRYQKKARADVSSCLVWICGGAPLPEAVAKDFQELFGTHISEGFGMLETSSLASNNFETELRHPGTVGTFHARMRAEIRGSDGQPLPAGETGDLWLTGANIMKGYYRNPEATAEAIQGGWLQTGDLGLFDEDGHLTLKGRSKEIIIVGGHNVYPREVENILLEQQQVADVAVAGESDPVRGERLLAFVVPTNGAALQEPQLLDVCRERLSPYKVPRAIHSVASIPRNSIGKILRRQLVDDLKSKHQ